MNAIRPRRAASPARPVTIEPGAGGAAPHPARRLRILIVDLNIFASFPTYAVGLLAASLRGRGHVVELICPLAHDVPPFQRERRETRVDHAMRRIHLSTWPPFRIARDAARSARDAYKERPHPVVLREVARALDGSPDIVLLSAYLQHFNSVREIGTLAAARGVPLLLGGPMFNLATVAEEWRAIPGLSAIVGAEADLSVGELAEAVCSGERLLDFAGVTLPDGARSAKAAPLRQLDRVPIPDYTDFPWDRYPVKIVPLMTGRGCQWDKCAFCSDVISASGRTFRTRSVESVLLEMQEQARRHDTASFVFLDLKLNSFPDMIRGIASEIQRYVQGAEWVGAVHVDLRRDNGLSLQDLQLAVAGGMRRVTFGLESGSQKLLDLMDKGTSVERNAQFIREAHQAGLSLRTTMFKGFPGETVEDMEATADFLERHVPYLDRVRFNEFTLMDGTPVHDAVMANRSGSPLTVTRPKPRSAKADYRNADSGHPAYRRAKARALRAVFEINRRELRPSARQFDGIM